MYEKFDVFICHASEDKSSCARPLYDHLANEGLSAFLDEKYIKGSDSFVKKINSALGQAKIVVLIISKHSVGKSWPEAELSSTIARDIAGKVRLFPLMVGSESDVKSFLDKYPLIADRLYRMPSDGFQTIAEEIAGILMELSGADEAGA